jgi:protein TonB
MAVQILNDMPDAEVHRGEPVTAPLRELNAPTLVRPRLSGRAIFLVITLALHGVAALAFMRMEYRKRAIEEAPPIMASLIEEAMPAEQPPPRYSPPPMDVAYSLPTPDPVVVETDAIASTAITATPMSEAAPSTAMPPLVENVEYLRAAPPAYPKESQRRHEYGTVILRILVDTEGRPMQIDIERSSGYPRLDDAAREAAEKFLFRPHEVNGVRQAAQVRIPIGFDPPRKS